MMLRHFFDIVFASLGLLLLSPLFIFIAVVIMLQDGRSPFFWSTRVGMNGHLFRLWKFRTMVVDASQRGPSVTVQDDPRITFLGRWLRKTKLDELPQLLNVITGEMSFVGPRPEDPRFVKSYSEEQLKLLRLKPGITSPASLRFRREEELLAAGDWERQYVDQILPAKLAIDLDYFSRRSLFSDLRLIVQTILSLFKRENMERK